MAARRQRRNIRNLWRTYHTMWKPHSPTRLTTWTLSKVSRQYSFFCFSCMPPHFAGTGCRRTCLLSEPQYERKCNRYVTSGTCQPLHQCLHDVFEVVVPMADTWLCLLTGAASWTSSTSMHAWSRQGSRPAAGCQRWILGWKRYLWMCVAIGSSTKRDLNLDALPEPHFSMSSFTDWPWYLDKMKM